MKRYISHYLTNNTTAQSLRLVTQTLFAGTLILYFVLLIIEQLVGGFVTNSFNPNILLFPIALAGLLFIVIPNREKSTFEPESNSRVSWTEISTLVLVTIIGSAIIFYKSHDQGEFAWILTGFTGLLILLVGIVMLRDKEGTKAK